MLCLKYTRPEPLALPMLTYSVVFFSTQAGHRLSDRILFHRQTVVSSCHAFLEMDPLWFWWCVRLRLLLSQEDQWVVRLSVSSVPQHIIHLIICFKSRIHILWFVSTLRSYNDCFLNKLVISDWSFNTGLWLVGDQNEMVETDRSIMVLSILVRSILVWSIMVITGHGHDRSFFLFFHYFWPDR